MAEKRKILAAATLIMEEDGTTVAYPMIADPEDYEVSRKASLNDLHRMCAEIMNDVTVAQVVQQVSQLETTHQRSRPPKEEKVGGDYKFS